MAAPFSIFVLFMMFLVVLFYVIVEVIWRGIWRMIDKYDTTRGEYIDKKTEVSE